MTGVIPAKGGGAQEAASLRLWICEFGKYQNDEVSH
jgi:hypothetical protein